MGNSFVNAFEKCAKTMQDIIIRLGGLKTNEFNSVFNYSEKIVLITFLIDGIHDFIWVQKYYKSAKWWKNLDSKVK